jgi:TrmH family RNA methyltransferase
MIKSDKIQLKDARELMRDKKVRDGSGLFVAEGLKAIGDIALRGHKIERVFVSTKFAEKNIDFIKMIRGKGVILDEVSSRDMDAASSLKNPEGVLAVMKKKKWKDFLEDPGEDPHMVLLDTVQDPANLGAIIRTASAFRFNAVLLYGECADEYNPKTVRASAGTLMDIPVCQAGDDDLVSLKSRNFRLLASALSGKDIKSFKVDAVPTILAFGSEGRGISKRISDEADGFFHIPMSDKAESLNVAAAAAISMYVFSLKV